MNLRYGWIHLMSADPGEPKRFGVKFNYQRPEDGSLGWMPLAEPHEASYPSAQAAVDAADAWFKGRVELEETGIAELGWRIVGVK